LVVQMQAQQNMLQTLSLTDYSRILQQSLLDFIQMTVKRQ